MQCTLRTFMRKTYLLFAITFHIGISHANNDNSIQIIEHTWITLSDGTKLAAKIWLPKDAELNPTPAILVYVPYRKRDATRVGDHERSMWFAHHGYASVRVDMRGSAESDGFLNDEYLKIEQDDALEVIAWIAEQPWCSGSVGIMGKSWSGFNALQIAARRPPALKAVISVCSSDDRYADDIHFMGGCLLNDNLWWGAIMMAYQARPLDPSLVGSTWREQWIERIHHMPFWPALWMKNQRRNEYWKHGSICENWKNIQCPVLLIGGWMDAYTNAIPRMLEHLEVPRLGIIGPWAHLYPHDGVPGPAIGFFQEACKWWDYWLKEKDNGIMNEPMLRAYIEEWSSPSGERNYAPGHWVCEDTWPSHNIKKRCYYLTNTSLSQTKDEKDTKQSIQSPEWTGSTAGEWMGTGIPGEMPFDQRIDDANSLTFDSAPLSNKCEILGAPELQISLASDKPNAQICVRLCDIAPDGSSRRISYQVLNLTHRKNHANPKLLKPGKFYPITIKLNDCGYAFEENHKIRIAISTAYWPLVWPSAQPATITVQSNGTLLLPQRFARLEDATVKFAPPLHGPYTPTTKISEGHFKREFLLDLLTNTATYITKGDGGLFGEGVVQLDDIGTTLSHSLQRELSINGNDPLSAQYILSESYSMKRPQDTIDIVTTIIMHATKEAFHLKGTLKAFENNTLCVTKDFNEIIERDFI